jgi:hypothetical protein
MDEVLFEFLSQPDDLDGFIGAFIDADPAPDAEILRNNWFAILPHDNGFIASAYSGAELDAFLGAPLWCASIL